LWKPLLQTLDLNTAILVETTSSVQRREDVLVASEMFRLPLIYGASHHSYHFSSMILLREPKRKNIKKEKYINKEREKRKGKTEKEKRERGKTEKKKKLGEIGSEP
jgi:hypothetical protein